MELIKKVIEFVMTNQDMILDFVGLIAAALVAIGGVIEAALRLWPTQSPDSFLERLGKGLIVAGEKVRKALDKIRVPNKLKQNESTNSAHNS